MATQEMFENAYKIGMNTFGGVDVSKNFQVAANVALQKKQLENETQLIEMRKQQFLDQSIERFSSFLEKAHKTESQPERNFYMQSARKISDTLSSHLGIAPLLDDDTQARLSKVPEWTSAVITAQNNDAYKTMSPDQKKLFLTDTIKRVTEGQVPQTEALKLGEALTKTESEAFINAAKAQSSFTSQMALEGVKQKGRIDLATQKSFEDQKKKLVISTPELSQVINAPGAFEKFLNNDPEFTKAWNQALTEDAANKYKKNITVPMLRADIAREGLVLRKNKAAAADINTFDAQVKEDLTLMRNIQNGKAALAKWDGKDQVPYIALTEAVSDLARIYGGGAASDYRQKEVNVGGLTMTVDKWLNFLASDPTAKLAPQNVTQLYNKMFDRLDESVKGSIASKANFLLAPKVDAGTLPRDTAAKVINFVQDPNNWEAFTKKINAAEPSQAFQKKLNDGVKNAGTKPTPNVGDSQNRKLKIRGLMQQMEKVFTPDQLKNNPTYNTLKMNLE